MEVASVCVTAPDVLCFKINVCLYVSVYVCMCVCVSSGLSTFVCPRQHVNLVRNMSACHDVSSVGMHALLCCCECEYR